MMEEHTSARAAIAILGGGNLGQALAIGWAGRGYAEPSRISVTRRQAHKLADLSAAGFVVGTDNVAAVQHSEIIVLAVQPQQLDELAAETAPVIDPGRHRLISAVSGVSINRLGGLFGRSVPIVRAMPNTAVSIGQSMTCLAAEPAAASALAESRALFELLGRTLEISEEMMVPATALCACGVAFFLRAIRAASQGGIEIGFHPEEALVLAAQTAAGAAGLLLSEARHPEREIDRVTTPRGCTIAGLNEMEHQGLSSALIKGILVSAEKADRLYNSG